jgi:hypothetical protein
MNAPSSRSKPDGHVSSADDILIEMPAAGVYVDTRGRLHLDPGERTVVRLLDIGTSEHELTVAAKDGLVVDDLPVAALTATRGGDGEGLLGRLGVPEDLAETLKLAAEVIGVVSGVGTAVSVVIKMLELIGLTGEENPFDELYDRIEQQLKLQFKATLAGQTLSTMQTLNSLIGHAETSASIVAGYLHRPTPERAGLLPQADYWSQYAANTMRGQALWLRTYDHDAAVLKAGAQSGWQFGPDVRSDLLMWDWRLPLLAYLKVLAARIEVIHVIDPDVDAVHRAEILGHAAFLRATEQRIRAGFSKSVPVPYPGFDYWQITARDACGVIDAQTGHGDYTGSFFPFYWWRDEIETRYAATHPEPTSYVDYLAWHQNGVEKRYWRLYDSLGLFSLWRIISDVQVAAEGYSGRGSIRLRDLQRELRVDDLASPSGASKARIAAFTRWSTQRSESAATTRVDRVETAAGKD